MRNLHSWTPDQLNQNVGKDMATFPWTQWLGAGLSGISGSFSRDSLRVTHVFIVAREYLPSLVYALLGVAYKARNADPLTGAVPPGMSRRLPFQCPQFPELYASQIPTFEPIGFDPAYVGKVPVEGAYGPYAPVAFYKVTCVFEGLPYDVFPDSAISIPDGKTVDPAAPSAANVAAATKGEQTRFMQWRDSGTSEILQRDRGSFYYDTAVFGTKAVLTSKTGVPIPRERQQWTWINVPDDGLYTKGGRSKGGIAAKLIAAQGHVNNAEFMGFLKWTLLFDSYEITPHIQPIPPSIFSPLTGGAWPATQAVRSWDVNLNFIYFDPNPDYTLAKYAFHGHQLLPKSDGNWYVMYQAGTAVLGLVQVPLDGTGNTTPTYLYRTADFTDIFTMN